MKFNMGCGHNRIEGFVNVDAAAACNPDEVWDLEQMPWPWSTGVATEVRFIHSMEHMGGDPKVFMAMMRELYRVCAPSAVVEIHAPHPRHDDFLNDPTHVRAISPNMLSLFDRELNDAWKAKGSANSPLAHYTGVDFKITEVVTVLAAPYDAGIRSGSMTTAEVQDAIRSRNNVVAEWRIKLMARKSVEPVPVGQQHTVSAGA